MTRFSLYDWQRKVKLAAAGKGGDNPVSGSDQSAPDERDRRILAEWKAHPGLGPSQVRNQLRRAGFKVSVHTVRRVLDDNGYVAPKVRRDEAHDRRYEAVRPNALWHMDFLQRYVHKQQVSVLLLLDDFSRYIVGASLWDTDRSQAVLETFEAAVARHGKPETVMSDGGAAFWAWRGVSQFTRLLEELSVDQIVAKVPQHNGKLEVLNANIQKELFNQERFFDLAEAHRRLLAWVDFYNYKRTSHALGGLLVPADRFHGRAERVLAEIEAGRSADGLGESLAVAARSLDLLRVTSRGGQVEVFLMGQRLWPAAE
jgi:transposase InsO family protein